MKVAKIVGLSFPSSIASLKTQWLKKGKAVPQHLEFVNKASLQKLAKGPFNNYVDRFLVLIFFGQLDSICLEIGISLTTHQTLPEYVIFECPTGRGCLELRVRTMHIFCHVIKVPLDKFQIKPP